MTVINLEKWTVERLASELEPRFEECGSVVADAAEVGDVRRWRKAARLAGRNLGHPVRTMLSSDRSTVFAFLDRPLGPAEKAAAAQRVTDSIFGPSPHLRLVKPEQRNSCRRIGGP